MKGDITMAEVKSDTVGVTSTEGMPSLICRLLIQITRNGKIVNEIRSSRYTHLATMLASYIIRNENCVLGMLSEPLFEMSLGKAIVEIGDVVILTVEGNHRDENDDVVAIRKYRSLGARINVTRCGSIEFVVRVYSHVGAFGKKLEHNAIELVYRYSDHLDQNELEFTSGLVVRSDDIGFAFFTDTFISRLRLLLQKGQSPLEFLTSDGRADEFLKEGLYLPIFGIRAWPHQVIFRHTRKLAYPIGIEVDRPRHLCLRPDDDGKVYVCLGSAFLDIECLESPIWPSFELPFSGNIRVRIFVSGGEFVTFFIDPSEEEPDPSDAIVNIDPFSDWHEAIGERLGEPLWIE
jgi:hypothetical protein